MITQYLESILKKLEAGQDTTRVVLVFPNGTQVRSGSAPGRATITIRIKTWRAMVRYFVLRADGFCEGFARGEIDIEGDDLPILRLSKLNEHLRSYIEHRPMRNFARWLVQQYFYYFLGNNSDRQQTKENAKFHYEKPAEFFHKVLGDTYAYTEGYYITGTEDLDTAQRQKFEYIARKLRLEPGMKVVEVGSGWGYMSCYMAKEYGVSVVNYGIVPEQNKRMREMIKEWGVEDKVTIVDKEHRELEFEPNTYDRYVSIGVYEHAGYDFWEDWIRSISVGLKEGGIGFLSFSGFARESVSMPFMQKNVWPGSSLGPLPPTVEWLDRYRLHVIDIENLWWHYRKTMEEWARNFSKNMKEIQALDTEQYDERFMRTWRLWFEGCPAIFDEYHWNAQAWHITFMKGKHQENYPLTRDFLYKK